MDLSQRIGQEFLFHLHDIPVAVNIGELQVKAGEFRCMLVGKRLFRTEYRSHLEDPLKPGCHRHLLVELRALCQIGLPVKILDLKYVGTRLRGRPDQLGRMDLHKAAVQQERTHGIYQNGLRLEKDLIFLRSQIDPAIINPLIN